MLVKKLKNNTGSLGTWLGQEIANGTYYQIQKDEEKKWIENSTIEADIISGDLIVNDGTSDLSSADGLIWIKAIGPTCVETKFYDLINVSNPPHQEGRFFYDHTEHAYAMYNDNPNVTHQLGQEFLIRVYNDSGITINDGKPVYVTGTEGVENRPTVALAQANSSTTSKVIGICTAEITNNTFGWITYVGLVNGLNTTSFSSGDDLYLDETTAGAYRTTPPPAGNETVHLGYVVRSHATEGRLLITTGDHFDHFGLNNNPHAVTKSQVGLGNADNTSDADKPVSTAQQTALNGKSDTGHTHTESDITDLHTHSNKAILDATTASFLAAQETKVNHITVTQAVDLDTIESDTATNNAKVSNVTHTSEITGATDLTIQPLAISNKTLKSTPSGSEEVLINDAGTLKKTTTQDIANLGAPISADMATVQIERTTTMSLTTTATNITWDTTAIENDTSVLEHDDINTERVYIREAGFFLGILAGEVTNTAAGDRTVTLKAYLNDTTLLSTISIGVDKSASEVFARPLILPDTIPADSYITIRISADQSSDVTLETGARVIAIHLKGQKGDIGPAGADGDITWEGAWVSQNYTTNQAVKYTDGSSYVCHTNTTASQVPTDTNYWDVLAEKGDTGPTGGGDLSISIQSHNAPYVSEADTSYSSKSEMIFNGTTNSGTPSKIKCGTWMNSGGTSYSCRVYDLTNSQVICEVTGQTNTSRNVIDMGTLSNLPVNEAVFSIELKVAGTTTSNISALFMEF